jgi:hypothetical protein
VTLYSLKYLCFGGTYWFHCQCRRVRAFNTEHDGIRFLGKVYILSTKLHAGSNKTEIFHEKCWLKSREGRELLKALVIKGRLILKRTLTIHQPGQLSRYDRLRFRRPRNRAGIPSKGKGLFSSLKLQNHLWEPSRLQSNWACTLLPRE